MNADYCYNGLFAGVAANSSLGRKMRQDCSKLLVGWLWQGDKDGVFDIPIDTLIGYFFFFISSPAIESKFLILKGL